VEVTQARCRYIVQQCWIYVKKMTECKKEKMTEHKKEKISKKNDAYDKSKSD
jgi:hypothetical protein